MDDLRNNTVCICIVNWNAGSQLRDCISSIGRAKQEGFMLSDVVIVDNGSTDDSLESIDSLGVPLKIIRNSTNRGFAAACNQGAAAGSGDYVLFLNPDTRLNEESLSTPVSFMARAENSHVGICGIQLVDEATKACLSYARFPTLGRFVVQVSGINKIFGENWEKSGCGISQGSNIREVDQVIGAFFLTRRTVFENLKGFDERFFVYFEEVDFAARAREAGWQSVCLTDVTCIHVGGGTSRQVKSERLFYSLRSRLLYGFKHFSLVSAIALLAVTLVPEFLSRVVFACIRGARRDVWHTVQGYSMLMGNMPSILGVAIRMRELPGQER